jgi:hypothetical protein
LGSTRKKTGDEHDNLHEERRYVDKEGEWQKIKNIESRNEMMVGVKIPQLYSAHKATRRYDSGKVKPMVGRA